MNRLVITRYNNSIVSALFEGMDMVQVNLNPPFSEGILGNIYLGKVKNIVKNINAAFIEIEEGLNCYYAMNENSYPIMAQNLSADGKRKMSTDLKIGDELVVQVVKEDVKTKAPVVSSLLNFTGKYIALTYGKTSIGVSSKISDDKERKRLKGIAAKEEKSSATPRSA